MLFGSRNAQHVFAIQTEKHRAHSAISQCHIRLKCFVQVFNKLHKVSGGELHENKPADMTARHYRMAAICPYEGH